LNRTILTAILLSSAVCGLSQQAETKVNARHVIGLENVKRNRAGKLTVKNGVMQFEAGTTDAKVPTAAIDDLSVGSETTQAGRKAGTVVKTAALATRVWRANCPNVTRHDLPYLTFASQGSPPPV
jgi:hypothetical protein